MRVSGSELLSRATVSSSRIALALSTTLVAVHYFELEPVNWPLLNQDLEMSVFWCAGAIALLFSVGALILHWSADRSAYEDWFDANLVPKGTLAGMSVEPNEPTLEALQRRLKKLLDHHDALDISEAVNKDHIRKLKQIVDELSELRPIVAQLDRKFSRVNLFAWILLHVWYLALPILMAAFALIMFLFHHCPRLSLY